LDVKDENPMLVVVGTGVPVRSLHQDAVVGKPDLAVQILMFIN